MPVTLRDVVQNPALREKIEKFCERWKIRELRLFGSTLRGDIKPGSDVDILVDFEEDADWSLWDHVRMQRELESLLQRPVDLITKRALEYSKNWLLRDEIWHTSRVLFPVGEGTDEKGRGHAA